MQHSLLASTICTMLAVLMACSPPDSAPVGDPGQPFVSPPSSRQGLPPGNIVIDGFFEDWESVKEAHIDTGDDGGQAVGVDFGTIKLTHDERYLYIMMEVGVEVLLNNGQYLKLFLDTDNDPQTGAQVEGIGAELEWTFGQREVVLYTAEGRQTPKRPGETGVHAMPTVSSERFEVAIPRDLTFNERPLLPEGSQVSIVLRDNTWNAQRQVDGDRAPNVDQALVYALGEGGQAPLPGLDLGRKDPQAIRIVSWNVLRDGIYQQDRQERFGRVLQAINPDIINFQELYNPEGVLALVQRWLPEHQWDIESHGDRTTLSRLPIVRGWPESYEPIHRRFTVVPIQVSDDQRMIIFNAHMSFGDNDTGRQDEADSFAAYMLELIIPGGRVDAPRKTPMVLLGDLNLVGQRQQLDTLLYGDIVNERRYGPPRPLDWDGTPLRDLAPRQTHRPLSHTWRSSTSSYWPGRLDYIIYTDSVMTASHSFILDTETLADDDLQRHNLRSGDTRIASDHLPLVVDFVLHTQP